MRIFPAALFAIAAALSGCAGAGDQKITQGMMPLMHDDKGNMTEGGPFTLVDYDQQVPDWAVDPAKRRLSFVAKGNVTQTQLDAIAEDERVCRIHEAHAHPNRAVAVIMNGGLYYVTGFPAGAWASTSFRGASPVQYGGYNAKASSGGGVANGIIQIGDRKFTFENCGENVMSLFPRYGIKVLQSSAN